MSAELSQRQVDVLLQDAKFELVIPNASLDASQNDSEDEFNALLQSEQRQFLFFDETAVFYLICRLPASTPNAPQVLESIISSLNITLEAKVSHFAENSHRTLGTSSTQQTAESRRTSSMSAVPPRRESYVTVSQGQSHNRGNSSISLSIPGRSDSMRRNLGPMSSNPVNAVNNVNNMNMAMNTTNTSNTTTKLSRLREVASFYSPAEQQKDPWADEFLVTYTYDPSAPDSKMMVYTNALCALCPLKVPIDIAKVPRSANVQSVVHVSLTLTQKSREQPFLDPTCEFCDTENFDAVNMLEFLVDDPYFNPQSLPHHRLRHQYKRRLSQPKDLVPAFTTTLKRTIAVVPALKVRLYPAAITHERILVSVEVSGWSCRDILLEDNEGKRASTTGDTPLKLVKVNAPKMDIQDVQVDVSEAIVTSHGSRATHFPIVLTSASDVHLLYSVMLLDPLVGTAGAVTNNSPPSPSDSHNVAPNVTNSMSAGPPFLSTPSSSVTSMASVTSTGQPLGPDYKPKHPILNITVRAVPLIEGCKEQTVTSRWYWRIKPEALPTSGELGALIEPRQGRKIQRKKYHPIMDYAIDNTMNNIAVGNNGLSISFGAVTDSIRLRKLFAVQVFILNRGDRTRYLELVVPNNGKSGSKVTGSSMDLTHSGGKKNSCVTGKRSIVMTDSEMVQHWNESERREATLVCLENNLNLILEPNTCQSLNLHFIAIKGHLHTLELVQLVDTETMVVMNLRNVLQIYVEE